MIPINRPDIDITDIVAFIKGHIKDHISSIEYAFGKYRYGTPLFSLAHAGVHFI
jgi:hypothetical protein